MMIRVDKWMLAMSSQVHRRPAMRQSYGLLFSVDYSLIIAMVQVSLDLRCSRLSYMSILCFEFIPCCLSEVAHKVMIGYSLRCSKVVE